MSDWRRYKRQGSLSSYLLCSILVGGVRGSFASDGWEYHIVISDGSLLRPFCSWSMDCIWNATIQAGCADRLCAASGFAGGVFNSATTDMCAESTTWDAVYYWLVDEARYWWGMALKEAGINATCYYDPSVSTPQPSTTTATRTMSTGTTTTVPIRPTTTLTRTASMSTGTTTMTTGTMSMTTTSSTHGPTETATQTSRTTTTTGTTTPFAPGTTTSLITTTVPASATTTSTVPSRTTASTTALSSTTTTSKVMLLEHGIRGTIVMNTSEPATFCHNASALDSVCRALTEVAGADPDSVVVTPSCGVVFGNLVSEEEAERRLTQSSDAVQRVQISYTMRAADVAKPLDASILASLSAASDAVLSETINRLLGTLRSTHAVDVAQHTVLADAPIMATTTSTTTTVQDFCVGEPMVLNAGNLSHCAGIRNGETCELVCKPGYEMEKRIRCESGKFSIPGNCLPAAAKSRTTRAIQIVLSLGAFADASADGAEVGDDGEPLLTMAWAEANRGTILAAVAQSLGLPPGQVLVDFVRRPSSVGAEGGNFNRRLDVASQGTLEMRVTVLVDEAEGQGDLSAVADRYQHRLVSGGASDSPAFAQALDLQLQAEGKASPSGLAVAATGPPAVIDEFVLALAEWLFSAWNPCSSVCGSGARTRHVECSTGEDFACVRDLGEKPDSEQFCEDFGGCDFDPTCPFGQGSGMSCGVQVGVALGGFATVATCSLVCLVRWLQATCRPHTQGIVTLPGTGAGKDGGVKATYQIYRPDVLSQKGSIGSMRSLEATADSCMSLDIGPDDPAADGKTHVIWDTDRESLKLMFAERGTQLTFSSKPSDGCRAPGGRPGMPRIASASRTDLDMAWVASRPEALEEGGAASSTNWAPNDFTAVGSNPELEARLDDVVAFMGGLDKNKLKPGSIINPLAGARIIASNGREMHPVYQESEVVEYFSCSLNRWLSARTNLSVSSTANTIRYDVVIIATGQRRVDAALEDLRRPLRRGEAAELYSTRRCVWHPVTISVNQPAATTNFGYAVDFPSGESQDKMPAWKLRRRFTAGDRVKAYRGVFAGWFPGRVLDVSEAAGDEPDGDLASEADPGELSPDDSPAECSRRPRRLASIATVASHDSAGVERRIYNRKSSLGSQESCGVAGRPWCLLCIDFEEEGSDKVDREWFPSYLVR